MLVLLSILHETRTASMHLCHGALFTFALMRNWSGIFSFCVHCKYGFMGSVEDWARMAAGRSHGYRISFENLALLPLKDI